MPLYDFRCGEGHEFDRLVPLAQFDEPQHCDCGAMAQRLVSAPMVIGDYLPKPIMGADGRMHDSRSSYEHSLTPEGNPQGERYHVLGADEKPATFKPKQSTEAERVEVAKKALHDVKAGNIPPINLVSKDIPGAQSNG